MVAAVVGKSMLLLPRWNLEAAEICGDDCSNDFCETWSSLQKCILSV
jgi:hypothetical protein